MFDLKSIRADLIRARTRHAGSIAITFRLSTMVEQIKGLHSSKGDAVMLRRLIAATAGELEAVTNGES